MILIADVHAHPYERSTISADGANESLLDIVKCLDNAIAQASSKESIVVAGDLFHARKGVPPEALERVGMWLERTQAKKVPVYILVGNHDLSVGGDGCSSIRALIGPNVTIVDEATTLTVDGMRVGFIPYEEKVEAVRAGADAARKAKARVLVAHLGLGDPMYSDIVPADYEVPGAINVSDLYPDDFDRVFLGHYHNGQDVTERVHYIGSPLQLSFKEAGQEKSIARWDGKKFARIVNNDSPKYRKLPYTEAVALLAHNEVSDKDRLWITDCTDADIKDIQAMRDDGARIDRIERVAKKETALRIDTNAKRPELLRQYVVTQGVDEVDPLVQTGLDLLARAASEV